MAELTPIIEQSFSQYAGAVLQSRALVDVRDCLKPSARQIFYSMTLRKLTAEDPFKKTATAVGMAMADFYIHGDSSATGIIMHAGQPFSMRYPLVSVKGNPGTQIKSGDWAAPRYTESKLSKVAGVLFEDINKNTIDDWRDSYDNSKQYPAVLPSKGFYNIVNGTVGIGIGLASSIPQFNLNDVNNALIYLIDHPDCDFDDIYCAPDFATGACLINESEVKESLKNGTGFACKIRSVVEYDSKERCFIVTEIPYGVYTSTICGELDSIIEDDNNPGIERYNDLTNKTPLIKIYLAKKANPDVILRYLFKNTSLQSWYSINMTMLDNGRYPKVFTWKEALQAHIEHEKVVYRNSFLFDLQKIEARLHIIEGLFICLARIDEVVQTIKKSKSTAEANLALQKNFVLDEIQAKAVLDMKLSKLAHLEVEKLEEENSKLERERDRIDETLNSEELFNNELKKTWREVAHKYGDARRTKILDLTATTDEEAIEVRQLQVSLSNCGNLYTSEASTLYTQRRGGVGNKFKMAKGEYIIDSTTVLSTDEIIFFTENGLAYHCKGSALSVGEKTSVFEVLPIQEYEKVCAFASTAQKENTPYIIFITTHGYVKKSLLEEYENTRNTAIRAITLNEGDLIRSVLFGKDENIGIMTERGNLLITPLNDIRCIGRIAQGVHGIKLNEGDLVISAHMIPKDTKSIASISGEGLFKKTDIAEFNVQGKNTKGSKIQKITEEDWLADFIPLTSDGEILIVSTRSCLKLTTNDIPLFSKGAQGNKAIKLLTSDNVVQILKM